MRYTTEARVEITFRFPKPEADVTRADLVAAFKAFATAVFTRAGNEPPEL